MSFSRRTFLVGAAAGFSVLVLTACEPEPCHAPSDDLRPDAEHDPDCRAGARRHPAQRVGG